MHSCTKNQLDMHKKNWKIYILKLRTIDTKSVLKWKIYLKIVYTKNKHLPIHWIVVLE